MDVFAIIGSFLILVFNFLLFVKGSYKPWYLAWGLVSMLLSLVIFTPILGYIVFNGLSLTFILYGIYIRGRASPF